MVPYTEPVNPNANGVVNHVAVISSNPLLDQPLEVPKSNEPEGEEVVVAGPICPLCNKAFATKNVSHILIKSPVESNKSEYQLYCMIIS